MQWKEYKKTRSFVWTLIYSCKILSVEALKKFGKHINSFIILVLDVCNPTNVWLGVGLMLNLSNLPLEFVQDILCLFFVSNPYWTSVICSCGLYQWRLRMGKYIILFVALGVHYIVSNFVGSATTFMINTCGQLGDS